jgi:hypothetical protein
MGVPTIYKSLLKYYEDEKKFFDNFNIKKLILRIRL